MPASDRLGGEVEYKGSSQLHLMQDREEQPANVRDSGIENTS